MTASTQEKNQSGQSSVNSQCFFQQRRWFISTLFPKTKVNTCVRFFHFGNNVFWITTFQSHCSVQLINNCNRCFQLFGHTRTHLHTARCIAFAFRLCLCLGWKLQKITRVKRRPYAVNFVTFDSELCLIWCGKRGFISLPRKTRYCGLYGIQCMRMLQSQYIEGNKGPTGWRRPTTHHSYWDFRKHTSQLFIRAHLNEVKLMIETLTNTPSSPKGEKKYIHKSLHRNNIDKESRIEIINA